ncbi:hypothetical protein CYMTET_9135 [Cymbomonas tetramitiformis]|uniref:Uncharacterized protein n=1 Tax=Cymbomonas tetramitiformis TaxID=36881 RepID=A0AAE0GSB2_9CHLO|nr:hypothetical protein CYMTET_9135 [Cymbomonas tetramitiformis]
MGPSALVTSSEYAVLLDEIAALKALNSSATAAAFCIPIEDAEDAEGLHTLALVQVFQEAADDGPEAFARAASAYGPPAVLSAGGDGGIDVSAYGFSVQPAAASTDDDDILRRLDALTSEVQAAQEKVHFTHASLIPGSGVEEQASALVCGPAAAAGIMPEEQVPAGGPWGFPFLLSLILCISIMGVGAAAVSAANDIDAVQVSGQAAPQPVLCRGDLCIYSGITELDPVTLGAALDSLGAAAVTHRLPDPLENSAAHYYRGHCGDGAPLAVDPE